MSKMLWKNNARTEEAKHEKRILLLRTAARMFNKNGFERTSLTDIACELGITKPSLYYYVNSKEEILFSINEIALESLKMALGINESENPTGRSRLIAFLSKYIEVIGTDFGKCLVTSSDMALSAESRQILKDSRKYIDQAVRSIIANGVEDGSLVTSSPKFAAFSIFGSINWMCYWYREDGGMTIEEMNEVLLELFLKGLEPR